VARSLDLGAPAIKFEIGEMSLGRPHPRRAHDSQPTGVGTDRRARREIARSVDDDVAVRIKNEEFLFDFHCTRLRDERGFREQSILLNFCIIRAFLAILNPNRLAAIIMEHDIRR
jgi:hypothetical protein